MVSERFEITGYKNPCLMNLIKGTRGESKKKLGQLLNR
jgi:hypothetical protein